MTISSIQHQALMMGSNVIDSNTVDYLVSAKSTLLENSAAVRYGLLMSKKVGAQQIFTGLKNFVVTPLLIGASGYMIYRGLKESANAREINDVEGKNYAQIKTAHGVSLLTTSLFASSAVTVSEVGFSYAKGALGAITTGSFALYTAIEAVMSAIKLKRAYSFRKTLKDLENKSDKEILEYFNSEMSVSDEKAQNLSQEDQLKFLLRKTATFKRRVGKKCFEKLFENTTQILERLKDPSDTKAVLDAKELIAFVRKENTKRVVYHTAMVFLSAVCTILLLSSIFLSGGAIVPAILSLAYIGIYSVVLACKGINYINSYFKNKKELAELEASKAQ